MKIGNKEINDECQNCSEVLQCELFRQGHGIGQQRENVAAMIICQLEHQGKRKKIMGCRQADKAQDFDSCIRRFESGYPSLGVAAPRNHMACFSYSFSFLNPLAES